MRYRLLRLGLVSVLLAALAFVEGGAAQPPPGKKGPKGPGGKFGTGRAVTAEQIVERIMSFDQNNDGKIDSDELPERMRHLIALGDINKDGALDKDEIRKLADALESFAGLTAPLGPGGGPFGVGGPKGGLPKGPGALKGGPELRLTLDQLNLASPAKEKANRLLQAHLEKIRKLDELARTELTLQMMDVLDQEDYRIFKSALNRPRPGAPLASSTTTDLNRNIDQIQKEFEELRGKLPK